MSVSLSGELVFKVTFDQHGFPSWHVHRAAALFIHVQHRYMPDHHLVIQISLKS